MITWFDRLRAPILFTIMGGLLVIVGMFQSWALALTILNLCIISAVMALGTNLQWGNAGLLNAGIMGFAAIGGLAPILVSMPPVTEAWQAGGTGILAAVVCVGVLVGVVVMLRRWLTDHGPLRNAAIGVAILVGFFVTRAVFDPAVLAIESVEPAKTGYLGGLGMPVLLSWIVGGLFAAGAAWLVAKVALGLRSDYLAIATLGISEIIVAILKNEDWLTRGVKNVTGLPRPVPYEIDLQQAVWFQDLAARFGADVVSFSSIFVKLNYAVLFGAVLLVLVFLSERALRSPWGRMMRAIRDNETAANAMGKDVTGRHLQVFVLGCAVVGIAGAMLTTLDGQFTPTSYQPLRYTFLILVMVIVGGSGNNLGAILGGFLIWFAWVEAEPVGYWLMSVLTSGLAETSAFRAHLLESAPHMRLMTMGLILLLVLRFAPHGLIPERKR